MNLSRTFILVFCYYQSGQYAVLQGPLNGSDYSIFPDPVLKYLLSAIKNLRGAKTIGYCFIALSIVFKF